MSDNGQTKSVTLWMAEKYGMEPKAFEATMLATVFPNGKATREQFAAVMIVAKQYGLNPLTKEVYAFPSQGGGIVPVVGLDGWARIINEHPAFDGAEFEDHFEGKALVAITCRIFRKDRAHPTSATEYMSECLRSTGPWKSHPRRMLRHKALIQTARIAFGFAGIHDPDEAARIVEEDRKTVVVRQAATDLGAVTARLKVEQQAEGEAPAENSTLDAVAEEFQAEEA